ncbi:MAG: hypothetical protein R3F55_21145 [Alphaproteobacteria bacterium]
MLALPAACQTGPAEPAIWTTADLARAIETNLAGVGRAVAGPWAPAGMDCTAAAVDMSLGADRPAFVPDVAALATLVPGAALTYVGAGPGEQRYRLGPPAGDDVILRELDDDAIVWRRSNGDEMRLSPDALSFSSGQLTLLIDEDDVRIEVGGALMVALERC